MYFFFKRDLRFVLAPKANIKIFAIHSVRYFFFFSCGQSSSASLFDCSKALFVNFSSDIFTRLCVGRLLNWKLVNFLARESLPKLFPLEKNSPCTVIGADLAVDSFCREK